MKFKTCNTGRVHETRGERTICGVALSRFTLVTPVADSTPVTCQHCVGESALFGKKRRPKC